jgi:hypothetical protein
MRWADSPSDSRRRGFHAPSGGVFYRAFPKRTARIVTCAQGNRTPVAEVRRRRDVAEGQARNPRHPHRRPRRRLRPRVQARRLRDAAPPERRAAASATCEKHASFCRRRLPVGSRSAGCNCQRTRGREPGLIASERDRFLRLPPTGNGRPQVSPLRHARKREANRQGRSEEACTSLSGEALERLPNRGRLGRLRSLHRMADPNPQERLGRGNGPSTRKWSRCRVDAWRLFLMRPGPPRAVRWAL